MPGESGVQASADVAPEAARRFFFEREDVSLGVMPQLLLGEREADQWALFWYAARVADDQIENERTTGRALAQSLRAGRLDTPAERAVHVFLRESEAAFERSVLLDGMERALHALDREHEFRAAPALGEYLRVVVDKAGFPLLVLNTLLLKGEPGSAVQRFSYLLAVSIQLGDDCRDLRRDLERGAHFITREEREDARRAGVDPDSEEGFARIRAARESVCKWLALRALDVGDRLVTKTARDLARTEVFLWLYQIESGQLREQNKPLRWPGPLAELLRSGPPSAPRLAAARTLVRNNPALFGDPRRWDEKNRNAVMKLLVGEIPDHFRGALGP